MNAYTLSGFVLRFILKVYVFNTSQSLRNTLITNKIELKCQQVRRRKKNFFKLLNFLRLNFRIGNMWVELSFDAVQG
jgi:hypothetical protein